MSPPATGSRCSQPRSARLAGGALQSLDGEELAAAIEQNDRTLLSWAVLDRDGSTGTLSAAAATLSSTRRPRRTPW